MNQFDDLLKGGDLRSIGQSNEVAAMVDSQEKFDALFKHLFHADRKVVMRAADAIEKITINHPGYLQQHKEEVLQLINAAKHIELKWHLALIVSRIMLTKKEVGSVWQILTAWAIDRKESKIVRVNAIQSLFNLLAQHKEIESNLHLIIHEIAQENIPSINARIRKLQIPGAIK